MSRFGDAVRPPCSLVLESDLVEDYPALAMIQRYHDRDPLGADASFRRALELAAGSVKVALAAAGPAGGASATRNWQADPAQAHPKMTARPTTPRFLRFRH